MTLVTGIKERLERKVEFEYQQDDRGGRWSVSYSLLYRPDRTPRFYGIGNDTPESAQTNYITQQDLAGSRSFNLIMLALLYTVHLQIVDMLPGTLITFHRLDDFPQYCRAGRDKSCSTVSPSFMTARTTWRCRAVV